MYLIKQKIKKKIGEKIAKKIRENEKKNQEKKIINEKNLRKHSINENEKCVMKKCLKDALLPWWLIIFATSFSWLKVNGKHCIRFAEPNDKMEFCYSYS